MMKWLTWERVTDWLISPIGFGVMFGLFVLADRKPPPEPSTITSQCVGNGTCACTTKGRDLIECSTEFGQWSVWRLPDGGLHVEFNAWHVPAQKLEIR